MRPPALLFAAMPVLWLGGCGNLARLGEIGSPPRMTPITNPTASKDYRPVSLPMPEPPPPSFDEASLWHVGARGFFKDQRAAGVGDLVTVVVNVTDAATLQDKTTASRASSDQMGMPNFLGLENMIPHLLSKANPASLLSTESAMSNVGNGNVARNETVTLRLAGVVTQVLANGDLVIAARQEMRVNNELRILSVTGVARPEDIASDNTISHDRMAEARISYGGRGDLSYAQTAPYGQQAMDAVSPF